MHWPSDGHSDRASHSPVAGLQANSVHGLPVEPLHVLVRVGTQVALALHCASRTQRSPVLHATGAGGW